MLIVTINNKLENLYHSETTLNLVMSSKFSKYS